jgi:hypothetical protein
LFLHETADGPIFEAEAKSAGGLGTAGGDRQQMNWDIELKRLSL